MTPREQLFADLAGDDCYGVLLMAQLDAVPETLQLIIATTREDPAAGGLRDLHQFIVRAIGVAEHRIHLGIFKSFAQRDSHPLLHQYNTTPVGLFFRGQPDDASALFVDVLQAYARTFGEWRQLPTYFNTSKPLLNLLASGGDLLGQMPQPLADNLIPTLEAHGLETHALAEPTEDTDEHGRSRLRNVLLMDDAYVVAIDFTVEFLGKA